MGSCVSTESPQSWQSVPYETTAVNGSADALSQKLRACNLACLNESRDKGAIYDSKDACCLYWALSRQEQENCDEERLASFHVELGGCLEFFGAHILSHDSPMGLLIGRPLRSAGMNAADTLVRMGQLLCRWAAAQQPPFGLRVGVHAGAVRGFEVPQSGGRRAYFGTACAGARRFAESAGKDMVVHLSWQVREQLEALRLLPLALPPANGGCEASYFLEPTTIVRTDGTAENSDVAEMMEDTQAPRPRLSQTGLHGDRRVQLPDSIAIAPPNRRPPTATDSKMPFEDFVSMLTKHNVDVSKFGRGSAKTLQEFYDAVVTNEKSFLTIQDNSLERVVELVRISLRMRDNANRLLELRIGTQQLTSGSVRVRNQPVAMVLNTAEQGKWLEAVESCFAVKFGLNVAAQRACFSMDKQAYSYREEKSTSTSVPGIMTTYRTHSIILTVRDKGKKELQQLGLPKGEDFTTETAWGFNNWTWAPVTDNKEEELMGLLQNGGIDVSEFTWQAFAELYQEVYEKGLSRLEAQDRELVRTISIIKVNLHADILNLDHILVVRTKHQKGRTNVKIQGRVISMRMGSEQAWGDAVEEALSLRVGISVADQRRLLSVDTNSHSITEEIGYSATYPGLKTMYVVNQVDVRVLNPGDSHWHFLGLPGGTDFTFMRQEAIAKTGESDSVITQWGWQMADEVGGQKLRRNLTNISVNDKPEEPKAEEPIQEAKRKVEPPKPLVVQGSDELMVNKLMLGHKTDWERAKRAAARIRDPDYTTREFYEDIVRAFPELRLYCISRGDDELDLLQDGKTCPTPQPVQRYSANSAGRSNDDEYQRTIGALFCVFWLMRLHLDGKECFCFGLDASSFKPRTNWDHNDPEVEAEYQKRLAFFEKTDWEALKRLLVAAGLISDQEDQPHDLDRTLTLLVLMALHDIMKLDVLLPEVASGLNEYAGYKRGETISDHDAALSYVLEHCPAALPSFSGLSEAQQDTIRFTHAKLEYNMGWLVQAEAPPGALFRSFRKVIIDGKATPCDVALYFVHWFTDLAGAEPFPMQGSEKFVLKFPLKVLGNFVSSFSVVWTLGQDKTETQVLEDYLSWRWQQQDPSLGPTPSGKGAIAQMRLILMAQGDSTEIVKSVKNLNEDDRQMLYDELSLTGAEDQKFSCDASTGSYSGVGPAILIYYAPALMQKAGRQDGKGAMAILAEVFRQARKLWPLSVDDASRTVIVRIDGLKDLLVPQIRSPEVSHGWILVKTSSQDGMVRLMPVAMYRKLDWNENALLEFTPKSSRARRNSTTAGGSRPSVMSAVSRLFGGRRASSNAAAA